MKEYRHYGSIGDVIKHLSLAFFLKTEKPEYYCETHSGSALYELDNGFNKKYGIFHLYESANKPAGIINSPYLQTVTSFNPTGLKYYPGSPGISLTILKHHCYKFIFCDINLSPLKNIQEFCEKQGILEKVTLYNGDGNACISDFVNSIHDRENIFVFIDPFDPFDNTLNGISAFDLFIHLTGSDVKTMVWYGYGTIDQRRDLFKRFHNLISTNERVLHKKSIYNGEIILNIIEDKSMIINPGVLGCGILIANLSDTSIKQLKVYGEELESVYKKAVIDNQFDGSIKFYFGELKKQV